MNKKLPVFATLFILCFLIAGNVLAQTPAIGVKAGDVFVYDISDSSMVGQVTREITVDSVSGTKISYSERDIYENGTKGSKYSETADVTVIPGATPYDPRGSRYFFLSNLKLK